MSIERAQESTKIKYLTYLPLDYDLNQINSLEGYRMLIHALAEEAESEMLTCDNFLKLSHVSDNIAAYYYNRNVNGILGDFSEENCDLRQHSDYKTSAIGLPLENQKLTREVNNHYPGAGVMSRREYETIFKSKGFENVQKRFGWIDLSNVTFALIDEASDSLCMEPQKQGQPDGILHSVDIYRCQKGIGLSNESDVKMIVFTLLCEGFVPVLSSDLFSQYGINKELFMDNVKELELRDGEIHFLGSLNSSFKATLGKTNIIRDAAIIKKAKDHFLNLDRQRANLKAYPPTKLMHEEGHWDLNRFATIQDENSIESSKSSELWVDVSGEKIYARNPLHDITDETVAIDFGTASTTVAYVDSGNMIRFMPIGQRLDDIDTDENYENPTILRYIDYSDFRQAYKADSNRPNTRFESLKISHAAFRDFEEHESMGDKDNLLQYLYQLKQWANDSHRKLHIQDRNGVGFELSSYQSMEPGTTLDPLEIYAYYIGLTINNMHRGKIHMKYRLSYSATHTPMIREKIRTSFYNGLWKSLPEEVACDASSESRFKVELGCSEATAFAVCALERYMEDARQSTDPEYRKSFEQEFNNGGIFCGVYDLGGGTLDYDFGLFEYQDDESPYLYTRLSTGVGGDAKGGCENILEELAFTIFNENANDLIHHKTKIYKPPQCIQYNSAIVGKSAAAQFNLRVLITELRKFWREEEESITVNGIPITLYNEEGLKIKAAIFKHSSILATGETSFGDTPSESQAGQATVDKNVDAAPLTLSIPDDFIDIFFNQKVRKGIHEFFQKLDEILLSNKNDRLTQKKCFIFLAGNASRASRVYHNFQELIEQRGIGNFSLHKPLPTQYDSALKNKNTGLIFPEAKSGVVYGLLLSRPGSEFVEIVDEPKKPSSSFRYHLGMGIRSRNGGSVFKLLIEAYHIPDSEDHFRFLLNIKRNVFLLRYTENHLYARKNEQPYTDGSVFTIEIDLSKHVGNNLYCHARKNSDCILELGVFNEEKESVSAEEITPIGYCDLNPNHMIFVPQHEDTD